jgi:iron-sulfur cluster repair protein YtfE (RIC family)
MNLIDTLKREHEVLRQFLNKVSRMGVTSIAGREQLAKSKDFLIEHLKKEDKLLYPFLDELVATKAISTSFRKEMSVISEQAMTFFDNVLQDKMSNGQLLMEFNMLDAVLRARMLKEENSLYIVYKKHHTHQAS